MERTVNLARIYYPVKTLGPGNRVGIWLAGCDRDCAGCISPELRNVNNGRAVSVDEIMGHISRLCKEAEGYTISGGEPFYDPEGLKELVRQINILSDDIIIYTGYTLNELRSMNDDNVDFVLAHINVLIDGPYIEGLDDGVGLRGSNNQNIHIFRNEEQYSNLEQCERGIQVAVEGNRVMTIGIPSGSSDDQ